jgi:carboxypeptidase Taq
MGTAESWTELCGYLREIEALEGAQGLLEWDQQTMMPKRGATGRGQQIAALAGVVHERITKPRVGQLLDQLEAEPLDEVQKAGVRNVRRTWNRATRVSPELVTKIAEAQATAFGAWIGAKGSADYSAFAPHLERLVDLIRERAEAIDATRHPYDVLLEEFDPGTTIASLRPMFARLRHGLAEFTEAIADHPGFSKYEHAFDLSAQRSVHNEVLRAMGFDFEAGRLDDAEHPFSIGFHPDDVRITTHLYPGDLLSSLSGTVHEGGHALYEQGLPKHLRGTGNCKAASFGLHESQSRFWENTIGRSLPFCRWLATRLNAHFPTCGATADGLYRAANRVEAGLIRIKADEVTYNLHIVIRFELELQLFEGKVSIGDLPEAWNARYREYLGVSPPDAAQGVLQDVHWSSGAFGYFPSYTLGNIYAASFGATLENQMPDLWDRVERGDFLTIREWLRENVHAKGSLHTAPEIVRGVTGDRDNVEDLLAYLWNRHGALYGVTRPARTL